MKACKNALNYSRAILEVIRQIINPVFKTNELPEITVSIAQPNQVLVGEFVYNILKSSSESSNFRELSLDPTKWKYLSRSDPESMYHVYESLANLP
jgi:hypothetical protein